MIRLPIEQLLIDFYCVHYVSPDHLSFFNGPIQNTSMASKRKHSRMLSRAPPIPINSRDFQLQTNTSNHTITKRESIQLRRAKRFLREHSSRFRHLIAQFPYTKYGGMFVLERYSHLLFLYTIVYANAFIRMNNTAKNVLE